MGKDKIQVVLAVLAVSCTYFLGSVFFKGETFYIFDIFWRIVTVASVLIFGRFNPQLSKKQIFILSLLVTGEIILYHFFTSKSWERIAISVFLAPIVEEVLFRGWIIDKVNGSSKQKIFFSSLCFALYHLKNAHVLTIGALVYQVFYAGIFIGPILAWVRIRTGSIFAGIVLHSGNNSIGDIVTPHIFPVLVDRKKDFN